MVFDWVSFGEPLSFWQMVLRIVAAVIFGAIIGVEREMKNRPAEIRTGMRSSGGLRRTGAISAIRSSCSAADRTAQFQRSRPV